MLQRVFGRGSGGSRGGGSGRALPDSPAAARAPTPQLPGDLPLHASGGAASASREGSSRRGSLFNIVADGSNHGGRRFFDDVASAAPVGCKAGEPAVGVGGGSREELWQQARAEEYALEVHSLQGGQHPAPLLPPRPGGRHDTAGLAAQRELVNGTDAAHHHQQQTQQQQQPAQRQQQLLMQPPHTAVWIVEDGGAAGDGSSKGGSRGKGTPASQAPPPEGPGRGASKAPPSPPPGGGPASGGGVSARPRKDSFGNAVVLLEEPGEGQYFDWGAYWSSLPKKLKGGLDTKLPVPPLRDIFWSWLGAFLGILAVCSLNQWVSPEIDIALLVGSFGASAVLVFAVLESKMSQPRNFLGGQMLSALVGITTRVVIHKTWIAGPVGMSLALACMQVTSTTHPPGGATALIAATLPVLPKWHGYAFLVTVGLGSLVMLLIALVVNNLDPRRRFPTYWY